MKLTKTKLDLGGEIMNRSFKLKAARTSKGYTQEKMSDVLGMAKATYCNKENGKLEFSESEMIKIANILEVSLDDIFLKN